MESQQFQEALTHNTTIQKNLREAYHRREKQIFPMDINQEGG